MSAEDLRMFDALGRLLTAQLAAIGEIGELVDRQREALRSADVDAIAGAAEAQRAAVGRAARLEEERGRLVKTLGPRVGLRADAPLRVLADRAPGNRRIALEQLADELRAATLRVKHDSAVLAEASRRLATHVSGILQTAQGTLSRVGVYERRGRVAVGARLDAAIDVRS